MLKTVKLSGKLYSLIHLISFLAKFKKYKREKIIWKSSIQTVANLVRSIAFMVHLVGGLKCMKCGATRLFDYMGWRLNGNFIGYF